MGRGGVLLNLKDTSRTGLRSTSKKKRGGGPGEGPTFGPILKSLYRDPKRGRTPPPVPPPPRSAHAGQPRVERRGLLSFQAKGILSSRARTDPLMGKGVVYVI